MDRTHHLRILIANQRADRLELLAQVVTGLGHEIIAREIDVEEVAAVTGRERPDVAFVGLGESSEHALELITEIVRGSFCPVIALLEGYDPEWIDQAAQRGVYAYIVDSRPDELQSAIDITLRRYAELQNLRGAFDRRSAEADKALERIIVRQRAALDVHDGVVQGLTIAHLALQLDLRDESREALLAALENARRTVARLLDDLRTDGVPLEQLMSDASRSGV